MLSCSCFAKHLVLWRILDYVVIIVIAIVAAVVGHFVRPHCREFSWSDASIQHPHMPDTFPMYSVAVAVVLVAIVSYFPGELLTRWRRAAGKMNMGLHLNGWVLAHAYSILLAFAIVNLSKLYAGRLRPDFIARLELEGIDQTTVVGYTHDQLCEAAREGRLSFPSGHSGTIFSGFVPTSLYLLGLMRTFKHATYWRAFVAFLPMILPIAVAVSRTTDYRHNFDDVFAGSMIGSVCGIFSVLLIFRPSRTGEWTLRQHPVDSTRNKEDDGSDIEADESSDDKTRHTRDRDSPARRTPSVNPAETSSTVAVAVGRYPTRDVRED